MPIRCVRFAPSTFMTSVQQWLDLVSSLEGLLLLLSSGYYLVLLSRLCSPVPAYTLRKKLRFSPVTWLPGKFFFRKPVPTVP